MKRVEVPPPKQEVVNPQMSSANFGSEDNESERDDFGNAKSRVEQNLGKMKLDSSPTQVIKRMVNKPE